MVILLLVSLCENCLKRIFALTCELIKCYCIHVKFNNSFVSSSIYLVVFKYLIFLCVDRMDIIIKDA